ncbi:hypothetical protein A2Y85_04790 [candidate division WOR-3 bacterium RBG_13_43_14]|uniref:Type II secretion system protein GspG C-terminal domain-containing protein n=1 Tax=candidate division WOR-3 bacterium RBG_13_43_14 TaxID=1802590 RepID=A0A1F4UC02_UNCW3|nr:MAG: hypothetical protein A2Y85_04790 [candidate division WOR-3 bacterium RBG_13_43_14]
MKIHQRFSRGLGVISILISLAVAALLLVVVITVMTGNKDDGVPVSKPIGRAQSVQCLSNIHAIEIAIKMYQAENGQYPGSLNDLKNTGDLSFTCPVNNAVYIYDPVAGTVKCPEHSR